MLRVSERTDRIHHIPQILYHWRAIPGSIAAGADRKTGVAELQARAVSRPPGAPRHRRQAVAAPGDPPPRGAGAANGSAPQPKVSVVVAGGGGEAA